MQGDGPPRFTLPGFRGLKAKVEGGPPWTPRERAKRIDARQFECTQRATGADGGTLQVLRLYFASVAALTSSTKLRDSRLAPLISPPSMSR